MTENLTTFVCRLSTYSGSIRACPGLYKVFFTSYPLSDPRTRLSSVWGVKSCPFRPTLSLAISLKFYHPVTVNNQFSVFRIWPRTVRLFGESSFCLNIQCTWSRRHQFLQTVDTVSTKRYGVASHKTVMLNIALLWLKSIWCSLTTDLKGDITSLLLLGVNMFIPSSYSFPVSWIHSPF
jgi:hypothetical protein